MTTRQAQRGNTAAAARTKPVRITVDLDVTEYTALHKWLGEAISVDTPKLTLSDAMRALLGEFLADPALADRVRTRAGQDKQR